MIEIFGIIGFLLASFVVVANDSIQTLGTFLSSNRDIKWYYLWAFISTVLLITFFYSWFTYGGDLTFGRLDRIPYITPQWYHIFVPLILIALTRMKIPVSTSLLVLSAFASSLVFGKILMKSALGYGIAAIVSYILWFLIRKWEMRDNKEDERGEKFWRVIQWLSTAFLWFTWLSHDASNVMVFLERDVSFTGFILVVLTFVIGLAIIFYKKGGPIQEIVVEKTNTKYVKSAIVVDLVYAVILIFFKQINNIPMSTTWVFIGLLTGREFAINTFHKKVSDEKRRKVKDIFPIVGKDFLRLIFGLAVSIAVALLIQNIFAA